MSNGFYSLIQFCPDLGRQEAFNVGVAVFCPETRFAAVKLAPGFGPNAPADAAENLELFEATKAAFARRFEIEAGRFGGERDMAAFRASGTNPLRLTAPRQIVLRDATSDVQAVFKLLVGKPIVDVDASSTSHVDLLPETGDGSDGRQTRGPRVKTRLKQAFVTRQLVPFVEQNVETVVPAFNSKLKVPYAYRNGRYNLIEPVDFTMRNEADREERTAWFAVVGKSIYETPDPGKGDRKLIVVARLPSEQVAANRVSTVLRDYDVDCVPFCDVGLDRLAAEIREHAGTHA